MKKLFLGITTLSLSLFCSAPLWAAPVLSLIHILPCVVRRLEVLGVTEYHGGADNKCTILDGMRKRMSLEWQEIAYLGDDWVDLCLLYTSRCV